jgi:transcriptional regulator with XRE-family HTH domain
MTEPHSDRRGMSGRTGLARDASPPLCRNVAAVATTFGAELRRLRLEAGLGTRRLAARSALSRRSVQYFEAGVMRPRRVTVGALAYGLDPDDQDRRKEIVAALVAAAGGEDALAVDGRWRRYRGRRFERGILRETVPLPADLARRLEAAQQSDAMTRQAYALLDQPGALDDGYVLDRAMDLLDESRRLRDIAGGPVTLQIGRRMIRAGWGA